MRDALGEHRVRVDRGGRGLLGFRGVIHRQAGSFPSGDYTSGVEAPLGPF
jgi:hypothetical protein